jgi:hypothetical protein
MILFISIGFYRYGMKDMKDEEIMNYYDKNLIKCTILNMARKLYNKRKEIIRVNNKFTCT